MLYRLSLYQIISCCLSLILFVVEFLYPHAGTLGLSSYFLSAILLGLTLYVIYVNTEFISKRKLKLRFRMVNQWFNILQVCHLSLFGVTLYWLIGPAITPELIYSDRITGDVNLNFSFSFSLFYNPNDSDLVLGVNLVPVLYLYLFNRAVRKTEKSENFELDLFKTKTPPRPNTKNNRPPIEE